MMDEMEVDSRNGGPLPMQFFSTWEVRKVPVNCMSRLCTLNITRLQILKPLEQDLQSVVLAISMKTPHRSLRSNELQVPPTGIMDITLNLTFSLQYPHFFKRGGNILEIRLQRRKRYRNRTIRGYKTLLRGEINMALVLQKSFQGVVKLFADKTLDHLSDVTVSSLTSIPTEAELKQQVADESTEEEEEELSESDSEIDQDPETRATKVSLKQPSSVLRLLRLKAKERHSRGRVPVEVTLGLEEGDEEVEEGVESIISTSDSYEEDEEESPSHGQATPRPRLRPFFGSDTLSLISNTQMSGDPEGSYALHQDKRNGSLELAMAHRRTHSHSPSEVLEPLDMPETGLIKGRLWLVDEMSGELQQALHSMDEPLLTTPTNTSSSSLLSLLNTLSTLWHKNSPFLLVLDVGDSLLSALIRAYVHGPSLPIQIFQYSEFSPTSDLKEDEETPIGDSGGERSPVMREKHQSNLSQDKISQFIVNLTSGPLQKLLPIAQAEVNMTTPSSSLDKGPSKKYIPFIYNVAIGPWETDTLLDSNPPPSSPPSDLHSSEILLEYWGGKKDNQKSSVKVRSVMVTVVAGPLLNVSAIIRKKVLRIRRPKDSGGERTIISLTTSHLSCRSTNKGEEISACIDGVEWKSFDVIKLSALWEQSLMSQLPILTFESDKATPSHTATSST